MSHLQAHLYILHSLMLVRDFTNGFVLPADLLGSCVNRECYRKECEVKGALESISTNKASGGDGIPVELFQILKNEAVKVLHSICQQI